MFVGVSFVAGGLNICGCIPMSVMWGFGMVGGSGGLIITCERDVSWIRWLLWALYLELLVWEPSVPILVSIAPHLLHIFIGHLSGKVLHNVNKVLLTFDDLKYKQYSILMFHLTLTIQCLSSLYFLARKSVGKGSVPQRIWWRVMYYC